MAEKNPQTLLKQLPTAESDYKFRFNRVEPGDHLNTEAKGNNLHLLEQQESAKSKEDIKTQINELVPPPGVPPPTAADVLKYKTKENPVDYCKPVEYQTVPEAQISTAIPSPTNIIEPNKHLFMPCLEGMHAPGNENAHLLKPAGYNYPDPSDVFRFNRVTPHYPPDPCIRPNEGDMMCPNQDPPPTRNHPDMPIAGCKPDQPSDIYRFHKVHPASNHSRDCDIPCINQNPALRVITHETQCPCANRPHYPPSKPPRHFDYRYPSGPVECNSEVHKRGHVPAECKEKYETDLYWAKPVPVDCGHSPSGQNMAPGQYTRNPQAYATGGFQPDLSDYYREDAFNDPKMCPMRLGAIAPTPSGRNGCIRMMSQAPEMPPNPYAVLGDKSYRNDYFLKQDALEGPAFGGQPQGVDKMAVFSSPNPACPHLYSPSPYVCRPVYNRKYLMDCPEQDGPPGDSYTFL